LLLEMLQSLLVKLELLLDGRINHRPSQLLFTLLLG
jgi:hypothetical protein